MDTQALKEYLLNRFPDARPASGGREVVMRCRFCGDSRKDPDARHLYVKVYGDTPFYNCFKCNTKGVMSGDILKSFIPDYGDDDLLLFDKFNKELQIDSAKVKNIKRHHKFGIRNGFISDTELSFKKLRYINKRLGLNLSYEDAIQNKIVLNLVDLLQYNRITEFSRDPNTIEEMSINSIGFLSMDNGCVILRNMNKGKVSQYIDNHYNVYSIMKDSRSMYTIPSTCDLMSLEPIHIHIAEGAFDILSICYNLRYNNRRQCIYTSVCGKRYSNAVKMYILEYGVHNAVFHIYPDNDVSNDEYDLRYIRSICKDLEYPLYIHRNTFPNEKDFGVDLSHIKEERLQWV